MRHRCRLFPMKIEKKYPSCFALLMHYAFPSGMKCKKPHLPWIKSELKIHDKMQCQYFIRIRDAVELIERRFCFPRFWVSIGDQKRINPDKIQSTRIVSRNLNFDAQVVIKWAACWWEIVDLSHSSSNQRISDLENSHSLGVKLPHKK
jgi:hypothetical protein